MARRFAPRHRAGVDERRLSGAKRRPSLRSNVTATRRLRRPTWSRQSLTALTLPRGVTFNSGSLGNIKERDAMQPMDQKQIVLMKEQATSEVKEVLDQLENDYPGVTEGMATALGSGVGAAGSLAALYGLGVTGLSAAGITSGLAAAGSIVGGGMVAGIGVLAAPIALLGIGAYAIAKKRKNAKLAAALGAAIRKLYDIQARLMQNAEYFKEEITGIKAAIDLLAKKKPA